MFQTFMKLRICVIRVKQSMNMLKGTILFVPAIMACTVRCYQLRRLKIVVKVIFKYRDSLSRGKWRKQSCVVDSVQECKEIYGLDADTDCEYEILSVEEV